MQKSLQGAPFAFRRGMPGEQPGREMMLVGEAHEAQSGELGGFRNAGPVHMRSNVNVPGAIQRRRNGAMPREGLERSGAALGRIKFRARISVVDHENES